MKLENAEIGQWEMKLDSDLTAKVELTIRADVVVNPSMQSFTFVSPMVRKDFEKFVSTYEYGDGLVGGEKTKSELFHELCKLRKEISDAKFENTSLKMKVKDLETLFDRIEEVVKDASYCEETERKRIYPTSKTIAADAVRERLERKLQNNTACGMCCRTWDDAINEKARKKEKTVQDVFNELTEEQKNVVYFMIGEALKSKESELKSKNEKIDELKEDLHNAEYQVKCWTRRCDELQKRLYEVKGVIEE